MTEELKINIQQLGGKGVPDTEIAQLLNTTRYIVSTVTKEYWEQKMKNKKNENNYN